MTDRSLGKIVQQNRLSKQWVSSVYNSLNRFFSLFGFGLSFPVFRKVEIHKYLMNRFLKSINCRGSYQENDLRQNGWIAPKVSFLKVEQIHIKWQSDGRFRAWQVQGCSGVLPQSKHLTKAKPKKRCKSREGFLLK